MKRIILYVFLCISVACAGQANKTLQDSVFVKGNIIKIPQMMFSFCKPGLMQQQLDSLRPTADFLKAHKNFTIEISVHSDSRGATAPNLKLTQERAEVIKESLIKEFAVDSEQIIAKGYGESKLVVSDITINKAKTKEGKEELHAKNRRMEMKILEIK